MERLAYHERMRDDGCYKLLASLVKDDVLVLTGVLSPAALWDTFRPREANLNGVNMGLVMPTATVTDLEAVAKGSGVKNVTTAWTLKEFEKAAGEALNKNELSVVVSKIRFTASHSRPAHVRFADEEKYIFMRYLERTEKKRFLRPRGQPLQAGEWSFFGVDEEKT